MSFWDQWRARYDDLTHEQHEAIYSAIHALYPAQAHYDAKSCGIFLDAVRPLTVLEIGGFDGELAATVLPSRDWIEAWWNIEICREAREVSDVAVNAATEYRYTSAPHLDAIADDEHDALIMSHSAEHMRWYELQAILDRGYNAIYLAMPIDDRDGERWSGYQGTHILEVGWQTISKHLFAGGYERMEEPHTEEVRAWRRATTLELDT